MGPPKSGSIKTKINITTTSTEECNPSAGGYTSCVKVYMRRRSTPTVSRQSGTVSVLRSHYADLKTHSTILPKFNCSTDKSASAGHVFWICRLRNVTDKTILGKKILAEFVNLATTLKYFFWLACLSKKRMESDYIVNPRAQRNQGGPFQSFYICKQAVALRGCDYLTFDLNNMISSNDRYILPHWSSPTLAQTTIHQSLICFRRWAVQPGSDTESRAHVVMRSTYAISVTTSRAWISTGIICGNRLRAYLLAILHRRILQQPMTRRFGSIVFRFLVSTHEVVLSCVSWAWF